MKCCDHTDHQEHRDECQRPSQRNEWLARQRSPDRDQQPSRPAHSPLKRPPASRESTTPRERSPSDAVDTGNDPHDENKPIENVELPDKRDCLIEPVSHYCTYLSTCESTARIESISGLSRISVARSTLGPICTRYRSSSTRTYWVENAR